MTKSIFFVMTISAFSLHACNFGHDPFADAFLLEDTDNDGFPDSEDCEPMDALSHPDSVEICDLKDNDCDGEIDEDPVVGDTWYPDTDGDDYGAIDEQTIACARPDQHSSRSGDCDDRNDLTHPNADEWCDGEDNDCDGWIDEVAVDAPNWYRDDDEDGFGSRHDVITDCDAPSGHVDNFDDCNDFDGNIHPDAVEICDGIDNNCSGLVDDEDPDVQPDITYYYDGDGDGFGRSDMPISRCIDPGYPTIGGDCDDGDALIYPGAEDPPDDDIDQDCDGNP